MKSAFGGILLALMLSVPAWCDELGGTCDAPKPTKVVEDAEDLARFQKALTQKATGPTQWWSATVAQVQAAPCRRTAPFTQAELEDWAKALPGGIPRDETINGVSFKNESPALLGLFRLLTTSDDPSGVPQKKFKSGCGKVVCAVQEIFGKKEGVQLLYLLKRFGLNGSQHVYKNASAWRDYELDDILMGLSDLPAHTLPLKPNQEFIKFKRGHTLAMYGEDSHVVANATISFFDRWSDLPKEERQYTIVHEISHYVAGQNGYDEDRWEALNGGWTKKTTVTNGQTKENVVPKDPSKFTSLYGMTNNAEDFAESSAAYRYNPAALKAASPEKYEFLKETLYDGLEYTSAAACDPSNSLTEKLTKLTAARITSSQALSENEKKEALKSCFQQLMNSVPDGGTPSLAKEDAESCVASGTVAAAMHDALASLNLSYADEAERLLTKKSYDTLAAIANPAKVSSVVDALNADLTASFKEIATTPSYGGASDCKALGIASYSVSNKLAEKYNSDKITKYANSVKLQKLFDNLCLKAQTPGATGPLRFEDASIRCALLESMPIGEDFTSAGGAEARAICAGTDAKTTALKKKFSDFAASKAGAQESDAIAAAAGCGASILGTYAKLTPDSAALSDDAKNCLKGAVGKAMIDRFLASLSADERKDADLRARHLAPLAAAKGAERLPGVEVAIQNLFLDTIRDAAAAQEKAKRYQLETAKDADAFCEDWGTYSYQSATKLDSAFHVSSYNYRDYLNAKLKGICLEANKKLKPGHRLPATVAEISCTVTKVLGRPRLSAPGVVDAEFEKLCYGKTGLFEKIQEAVAPYWSGKKAPATASLDEAVRKECGREIFAPIESGKMPYAVSPATEACAKGVYMKAALTEAIAAAGEKATPALVQAAYGLNLSTDGPLEDAAKKYLSQEISRDLKDALSKGILKQDDAKKGLYADASKLSKDAFCSEWSRMAYSSLKDLDASYGAGDTFFTYNRAGSIERVYNEVCLRAQNATPQPLDPKAVSAALDQLFP
jgi:hypothetical protein